MAAAEQQLLSELAATRTRLDAARAELADRERDATEAEQAHVAAVQAEADRREGLARLSGQVETMRARVESIDDGVAKLSERIEEAAARAQQAKVEFETVQSRVGELDQGEVGLDEHHDRTVTALRWPTSGSLNCNRPNVAPNVRSPRCGRASRRCRWPGA